MMYLLTMAGLTSLAITSEHSATNGECEWLIHSSTFECEARWCMSRSEKYVGVRLYVCSQMKSGIGKHTALRHI